VIGRGLGACLHKDELGEEGEGNCRRFRETCKNPADCVLLLPEAVDDYVGADNPVRFIDAFVDGLDLAVAGFRRVEPKATGRPGYAPADLLKLYIYGYLNRVRSSRRLEAECYRNIEIIIASTYTCGIDL
jgi:transposase